MERNEYVSVALRRTNSSAFSRLGWSETSGGGRQRGIKSLVRRVWGGKYQVVRTRLRSGDADFGTDMCDVSACQCGSLYCRSTAPPRHLPLPHRECLEM